MRKVNVQSVPVMSRYMYISMLLRDCKKKLSMSEYIGGFLHSNVDELQTLCLEIHQLLRSYQEGKDEREQLFLCNELQL